LCFYSGLKQARFPPSVDPSHQAPKQVKAPASMTSSKNPRYFLQNALAQSGTSKSNYKGFVAGVFSGIAKLSGRSYSVDPSHQAPKQVKAPASMTSSKNPRYFLQSLILIGIGHRILIYRPRLAHEHPTISGEASIQ
jgi:hypothetical protein